MKKGVLSLFFILATFVTVLVGCGNSGDSVDINKENQISASNFSETMEAFKEFYGTFYEEHRFNGTFEQPEDCLANIYMLGTTPVMVVLDAVASADGYFTADLYVFEYDGRKVQERAKYASIKFGDDEIYIYSLQDKLYISYMNEERNPSVAELAEYFTKLKEEVYFVAQKGYEDEFENEIETSISTGKACDDLDEFIEYGISNERKVEAETFHHTGFGKDNYGGDYLIRYLGIEARDFNSMYNYALVTDHGLKCETERYKGYLYETEFKKYLDYLAEQKITNNVQLLVSHADYLESIGVYDYSSNSDLDVTDEGKSIDTVVWFDGIYYYIKDEAAYPIVYDYGYSEEDLPKKICSYEVETELSNVFYGKLDENNGIFPIYEKKRKSVNEIWKDVADAKTEWENGGGAALIAYRDYLYEKNYYNSDFSYAFVLIDDNASPELFVTNIWGYSAVLAYSDGFVTEQQIWDTKLSYYEREGIFVDSSYDETLVYQLHKGAIEVLNSSENGDISSYLPDKNPKKVSLYDKSVYNNFDEACGKAGLSDK